MKVGVYQLLDLRIQMAPKATPGFSQAHTCGTKMGNFGYSEVILLTRPQAFCVLDGLRGEHFASTVCK